MRPKTLRNVAAGFSLRIVVSGDLWRKLKLAATKNNLGPESVAKN
jgi:hypothetical protein